MKFDKISASGFLFGYIMGGLILDMFLLDIFASRLSTLAFFICGFALTIFYGWWMEI